MLQYAPCSRTVKPDTKRHSSLSPNTTSASAHTADNDYGLGIRDNTFAITPTRSRSREQLKLLLSPELAKVEIGSRNDPPTEHLPQFSVKYLN